MKQDYMKDYHINIFYSEEDEGYTADIPNLKYCSAFGETVGEAAHEVLKAKTAWLGTANAEGKPELPPKYRPTIYLPFQTKFKGDRGH
ncbi:MAG: type II toxin-antitoxin system HicB family antitoxin [Leptolyngbya sp. BL-A-14]